DGTAYIEGEAPVATMKNYQKELTAYTRGQGKIFCSLKGYEPCHNTEEVIRTIGYDPERDVENPSGSVFCANGSGFLVSWDRVKDYMHVERYFKRAVEEEETAEGKALQVQEKWLTVEEVDRILTRASFANQGKRPVRKNRRRTAVKSSGADSGEDMPVNGPAEQQPYTEGMSSKQTGGAAETDIREEFLLVD